MFINYFLVLRFVKEIKRKLSSENRKFSSFSFILIIKSNFILVILYIKMPLIIITGGPCSGKSTRAQALYEYFQTKSMPVQIITDNNLDRNSVYAG